MTILFLWVNARKDVTLVREQWGYIFLALTHRFIYHRFICRSSLVQIITCRLFHAKPLPQLKYDIEPVIGAVNSVKSPIAFNMTFDWLTPKTFYWNISDLLSTEPQDQISVRVEPKHSVHTTNYIWKHRLQNFDPRQSQRKFDWKFVL